MPLRNLNAEQLSAVNAPFGHNLIIASAGTGKTSTIVGRIAKLLNDGVNPREILLLTFTNKAANEMISRLERHFSPAITKQINAGTFHAVAYRYLKEHSHITLKQPRELKTLLKSIVNVRRFDESVAHYKAEYLYDLMSLYVNTNANAPESSLRGAQSEVSATKQSTPNRHTERSEVSKTRESKKQAESMIEKRINESDSTLQHYDSSNSISSDLDSSLISFAQNDESNPPPLRRAILNLSPSLAEGD